MDSVQAIILALIQGLTEFLPISSSAHLILPAQVLGWEDQGLAFDVAVHVGTLFAIVLYFRHDLLRLTQAWCGSFRTRTLDDDSRLAWLIIWATIPALIVGAVFGGAIESHLRSSLVIATTTVVFGLALLLADRKGARSGTISDFSLKHALWVGLAQALALIPGTSRSGITMTVALLLGYGRDASARFSFFLSIPLILAAGTYKAAELVKTGTEDEWTLIALGTVVAFVSAYTCIHLFLKFLEQIGFAPFVVYRLLLGAVLFALFFVS